MGNLITNRKSDASILKLSNGATSVLIAALSLSASDSAVTDWEKSFASWIASHDQTIFGMGAVSFDVDDVDWTREDFASQKAFVLGAVDMALKRHRWNALPYTPADFTLGFLQIFRQLVEAYHIEFIAADHLPNARYRMVQITERCPTHDIYLHEYGCVIHNENADAE